MRSAQETIEIKVIATWDDEAKVWWARSDDIRGLAIEADTLETLTNRLESIVPELVELNGLVGQKQLAEESPPAKELWALNIQASFLAQFKQTALA